MTEAKHGRDYRGRSPRAVKSSDQISVPGPNLLQKLTCRWLAHGDTRAVIVFCHGLGGGREYYAPLSEFWASHGYLVIHPNFDDDIRLVAASEPELGLDPADASLANWPTNPAIRQRMHQILLSPQYWLSRIAIVGAISKVCAKGHGMR